MPEVSAHSVGPRGPLIAGKRENRRPGGSPREDAPPVCSRSHATVGAAPAARPGAF